MQQFYDVYLNDRRIGQVSVSRQGLYYIFACIATLPQEGSYRLWAETNDKRVDLGILVPGHGCFELAKRVPVKQFTTDQISFVLRKNEDNSVENWVQIDPGVPFPYIRLLENAQLKYCDGKPGAILKSSTTEE